MGSLFLTCNCRERTKSQSERTAYYNVLDFFTLLPLLDLVSLGIGAK
jgi:hypothetical protein